MLDITKYRVEIELIEDMLGTVPKNQEVYASYIATKGRELIEKAAKKGIPLASGEPATDGAVATMVAEEVETIEEVEEKGWTGFHTDEEGPFLFDYAVKGFLCEAARTLKKHGEIAQLQDKIKRYCFVQPRRIRLPATDGVLERPLRAMTAQGPRVTVVRSDIIKAGTVIKFDLAVLNGGQISKPILSDIFEYGGFIGLGQWRSGGSGRFALLKLDKE